MSQSGLNQYAQGQPQKTDLAALESLRARLMPLVYNLESLKMELANPNAPADWPSVQRNVSALTGLLNSIQSLLNDIPSMSTISDAPKVPQVPAGQILSRLHPFPVSPFPIETPAMAGLLNTIMRKKPDLKEEKWILDRLAKAQEFAHVPDDWGVEPWKRENGDGDGAEKGEDAGDAGSRERRVERLKRQNGTLGEDDLADIWENSADLVEKALAKVAQTSRPQGQGEEQEGESEEESESEPEKEKGQGQEDVSMGGMDSNQEAAGDATGATATAKTVVAPAMMPLEVLHKFMTTGTVDKPEGQRPV